MHRTSAEDGTDSPLATQRNEWPSSRRYRTDTDATGPPNNREPVVSSTCEGPLTAKIYQGSRGKRERQLYDGTLSGGMIHGALRCQLSSELSEKQRDNPGPWGRQESVRACDHV
eukprot:9062624-Pyramimonas_sp.AAC.1